jgi:signal transduction histidine kinase
LIPRFLAADKSPELALGFIPLISVLGCAIDLANITARYVAPIRPSETGYTWMINETGRIDIFLMEVKDNLLLLLKDTGYGIPRELERRIFYPYFTTKENGTGLELALMQYVANAHNGWVDVESQEGSVTTFIFSVPLHGHDQEGV